MNTKEKIKEFRKKFVKGTLPMQTPGGGDPQDAEEWIEADIEEFEEWLWVALTEMRADERSRVVARLAVEAMEVDCPSCKKTTTAAEDIEKHLRSKQDG